MTKILALDTSTDACSVALIRDGELHEKMTLEPRAHARLCLPMVKELLEETGMTLKELDAIAFGRGPGSFTGVRIAASITQGLAFSLNIPVVPVSTLEAMVFQFGQKTPYLAGDTLRQNVLAMLDARMNEVYAAVYELKRLENQCLVTEISAEVVIKPDNVTLPQEPYSVIGSGLLYQELMPDHCANALICDVNIRPQADAIAHLGMHYLQEGKVVSAIDAQPVYLRNEVAWEKLPGR